MALFIRKTQIKTHLLEWLKKKRKLTILSAVESLALEIQNGTQPLEKTVWQVLLLFPFSLTIGFLF